MGKKDVPNVCCAKNSEKEWRIYQSHGSVMGKDVYFFFRIFFGVYMDVSRNSGTPKSSNLIGISIIFTIHFGVSLIFGNTQIYPNKNSRPNLRRCFFFLWDFQILDGSLVEKEMQGSTCKSWTRWWFQIFLMFTPKIGENFQFD